MAARRNHFKIVGISLGTLIVLFIVSRIILRPSAPIINVQNAYAYHGGTLTLTGSVLATCSCTVQGWIGDDALVLDENGRFTHTIALREAEKDSSLQITAEVFSRLWGGSVKNMVTITAHPEESPLALVDVPSEWKAKEITMKVKVLSGSTLELRKGIGSYITSDPQPYKAEWSDAGDGMRLVTIRTAFDGTYENTEQGYGLMVKADGYTEHEEKLIVKNLGHDAERVAADKEKSQREMKLLTMEDFNYGDSIMIAVSRNMPKSRTLGYRYVNSPETFQFVRMRVTVRNAGLDEIHVNPNYITIMGSNGVTYNPDEATYGLGGYLDAINLQPGGSTSGWLAFILPKDDKEPTLIYSSFDGTLRKKLYIQ